MVQEEDKRDKPDDKEGETLKEAKAIAEALTSNLRQVKAISLYGSIALGYSDKYTNDADLAVFVEALPSIKERKKALAPIVKEWKSEYDVFLVADIFDTDKLRDVSIFYFEIKSVENWLSEFKRKRQPFFQLVDCVLKAKTLYDPHGLLKGWKSAMRRYPNWLRKQEVSKLSGLFRFTRSDTIPKEKRRGNWNFLNHKLAWEIVTLQAAVYALNREYWSSPKWSFRDYERFEILPKDYKKRMKRLNKPDGINFEEKVMILDNLAWEVLKIGKKEITGLKVMTEF